jgi:hypothetical protein
MHRITICSAGPSLRDHLAVFRPSAPLIAVNRGALFTPCDWLVAGDITTINALAEAGVRPRIAVCTLSATAGLLPQGHCPAWRDDMPPLITWEELPGHGQSWCRRGVDEGFSLNAACALAHQIGLSWPAVLIEILGHDASASPDCGGHTDADRSAGRWQREERELTSLQHDLRLNLLIRNTTPGPTP